MSRLHHTSIQLRRLIYSCYAHSLLSYCTIIWDIATKSALKPLCAVQTIIIKKIYNYSLSGTDAFKRADILNIFSHVKYQAAVYMFKIIHEISPKPVCELVKTHQTNHNVSNIITRGSNALKKPQYTLGMSCNCISWFGIDIWNNLHKSLKTANTLCSFKKLLKGYIME